MSQVTIPEPDSALVTTPHKLTITIILMVATAMQALDMTIVNIALPHMQASLGATKDQIAWVLTSYIVATAIVTPLTGWLSARLGRTRLFIVSMVGFTVTSVFCGAAQTLPLMVAFRLLQGVFAASLMPLAQAIMLDIHTRKEMGRAMSIWSMGVMAAPILGPTIGAYLTDAFNWRWCFYINLPLGILTVLSAAAFMPKTARVPVSRFDWFGFAFLSLTLACLQLVLDRGEHTGWFQSVEIKIEAVLALFGVYMFGVHSATTPHPFLSSAMFKDRTFTLSLAITLIIGIMLQGPMVLWPQMLQTELNYPVITAGLILGPRGIGTIVALIIYGRISNRVDQRLIVGTGLFLVASAMYTMSGWSLEVSAPEMIFTSMLQGFGMGFSFGPMSVLAFATLPVDLRTEASGLTALIRNMGGSLGISFVVSQLLERTQASHARLSEYMTPFRQMPALHGAAGKAAIEMLNLNITQQAGMVAYINVFRLLAVMVTGFIPLVFFFRAEGKAKGSSAKSPAMFAE